MPESIQIVVEAIEGNTAAIKNVQTQLTGIKTTTEQVTKQQTNLSQQFKNSWTEINSAVTIGLQAFRAIQGAVEDTVGAFVKYADQVRTISQITGQSSEAVSRMIQVTDDYKIKTESLTMVMKKMATEGLPLTIDSLANLSDEYLKLNDGAARQIFLTEKFGRAGADFSEIMLAGGDAIREQSGAVSENLILTDEAVKKAREYEIAQDDLKDASEGLAIAIGTKIVPGLTAWAKGFSDLITNYGAWQSTSRTFPGQMYENQKATQLAKEEAEKYSRVLKDDFVPSMIAATDQTDMFGYALQDGVDALEQAGREFNFVVSFAKQYETNLNNVTTAQEDLKVAQEELFALTQAGWSNSSQKVIDAKNKVEDLKGKLGDAQQASLNATNEMIAGFFQAQLMADGSFTQEDIQKVLNYRFAVGLITQEAYDAAQNALSIANALTKVNSKDIKINVTATGDTWIFDYMGQGGGEAGSNSGDRGGYIPPMAGGGDFKGWAMVGDAPGGKKTPYTEYVYAPQGARVYNQSQIGNVQAPPMAGGGSISPIEGFDYDRMAMIVRDAVLLVVK
jgi:hypothetical protein